MKPDLLAALLFFATLLSAEMLERTRVMMGTFATLRVPAENAACAEKAFARMAKVEKALSSYDPEAEIARLNRTRDTAISADTYEALSDARRYYVQSGGYFDITIGSVTRKGFRFGEAERIPDAGELKRAKIGFNGLEFNATHARLEEGITLDLGGFGKGFGVDKAMETLKACGVKKAAVGLSGDIRCLGGCAWAIEDPAGGAPLFYLRSRLDEAGISTSGTYRRYVNDQTHHHLINPKHKTPETDFVSVTLVGDAPSGDLDAWTTAAAVMPEAKARQFLRTLKVGWVLVYPDGSTELGPSLERYVTLSRSPEAPSTAP